MDGQDPEKKPMENRYKFDEFLKECEVQGPSAQCPNMITNKVIGFMNRRMIEEDVPLDDEHFEVLMDSIQKGESVCVTMRKEQDIVLRKDLGGGFFYRAGRTTHAGLRRYESWKNGGGSSGGK